jgi:hypothetical protein
MNDLASAKDEDEIRWTDSSRSEHASVPLEDGVDSSAIRLLRIQCTLLDFRWPFRWRNPVFGKSIFLSRDEKPFLILRPVSPATMFYNNVPTKTAVGQRGWNKVLSCGDKKVHIFSITRRARKRG